MFTGPIFIVGRPRSGTKLLRSLLNAHSKISIPYYESNFIPQNIGKVEQFGDLAVLSNFIKFFNYLKNFSFFQRVVRHDHYKDIVSASKWYERLESYTYAGAIEAFFRLYAEQDCKAIWGDKSPHYMLFLKELKGMFPEAKFIHIIRDVRDHCLSSQKLWNKNPYRASKMWRDSIIKCRSDAELYLRKDYFEIKYEDLIENTDLSLRKLCDFLGIDFEKNMLILDKPAENFGDTKLVTGIVRTNKNKWRFQMPDQVIKRIEEISFDLMKNLNYYPAFAGTYRPMSSMEVITARMIDAYYRFIFDCRFQGGLFKGIKYQLLKRRYG